MDKGVLILIEQIFKLSRGNEKAIERVVYDENIHYLHMVFNKDQGLPEHFSNSNVYMTVIEGKLSIGLDDQIYLNMMQGLCLKSHSDQDECENRHSETLELIVVKAPAPGTMKRNNGFVIFSFFRIFPGY